MSDVNSIVVSGRLAKDPELRKVSETSSVAGFRIASNRKWGSGEDKQETLWIDIECWGGLAKVVSEYCVRGQEVVIVGRLTVDAWTDKEGNNRNTPKIVASDISFGSKPGASASGPNKEDLKAKLSLVKQMVSNGVDFDAAIKVVLES